MFCLIQLYIAISESIKQYKPLLQLFSIKAIIFLMFWQTSFLSALHSFNVIKDVRDESLACVKLASDIFVDKVHDSRRHQRRVCCPLANLRDGVSSPQR